jgi:hypothetical protein
MSDVIPCVGGLGFVFLILAFIVLMRFLSYQETLKLAEKGLVKPMRQNNNGNSALIWGILMTAIGVALTIGIWPLGFMVHSDVPFGFGPWMLVGLLPMFFGLALILIYVLTREARPKDEAGKSPEDHIEKP